MLTVEGVLCILCSSASNLEEPQVSKGDFLNALPVELSISGTVANHLFDELVHNLFIARSKHGWDTYLHSEHKKSN